MPQLRSFYDQDSFREPDFVLRYAGRSKIRIVLEGAAGRQLVVGLFLSATKVDFLPTEQPLSVAVRADIQWSQGAPMLDVMSQPDSAQLASLDESGEHHLTLQFLNFAKRPDFSVWAGRHRAGQAIFRNNACVMTVSDAWRDRDTEKGHLAHLCWTAEPMDVLDAYAGVLATQFLRGAGV